MATRRVGALTACVLAVAVLMSASGCSMLPAEGLTAVINPSIKPSNGAAGVKTVQHTFDFERTPVQLSVPLDAAVYVGATQAQKNAIFIGGGQPADWTSGYYRAFVAEEHQDPFYASLSQALRTVAAQRGLDSDRYVELVTSMSQSMEYRIDPGDLAPKFPIETFGDRFGDCDDKTLLAAAILAHDGYDVAVLLFGPEEHVAMGIKAPGLDYAGTGYAYVEMSNPSMVGFVPKQLAGGIVLESKPDVIRIGDGERTYGAAAQIEYLRGALDRLETQRDALGERIETEQEDLESRRVDLESARRRLEDGTGTSMEDVSSFNARVADFNRRISEVERDVERYNRLSETLRFATENQTARPQVHQRLQLMGL